MMPHLATIEYRGTEQPETRPNGAAPPEQWTPSSEARLVQMDYPAANLRMAVNSRKEYLWRACACAKEPWTVAWIESMAPGEVLYDVGASTGPYSLIAASRGVRVFAFEPHYASYARLVAHVALNGLAGRICPLPIGLSARSGLGLLHATSRGPGYSAHTFSGPGEDTAPPQHPIVLSQPVLSFRLDDLASWSNGAIPPPNHIKLDVDGTEGDVLQGARATTALPSFRSLLLEMDEDREAALTEIAREIGLEMAERLDTKASPSWGDGQSLHTVRYRPAYGIFRRAR